MRLPLAGWPGLTQSVSVTKTRFVLLNKCKDGSVEFDWMLSYSEDQEKQSVQRVTCAFMMKEESTVTCCN